MLRNTTPFFHNNRLRSSVMCWLKSIHILNCSIFLYVVFHNHWSWRQIKSYRTVMPKFPTTLAIDSNKGGLISLPALYIFINIHVLSYVYVNFFHNALQRLRECMAAKLLLSNRHHDLLAYVTWLTVCLFVCLECIIFKLSFPNPYYL